MSLALLLPGAAVSEAAPLRQRLARSEREQAQEVAAQGESGAQTKNRSKNSNSNFGIMVFHGVPSLK